MRLSEKENRLVQDLTKLYAKPRNILSTLKKQFKNNVSSLKTVYNARQKFQMVEKESRTPMQNVMCILQRLPIPLNCIDLFWTKLDLLPSINVDYGDVGYDKVVEMFEETFNKQSIPVKFSLIRKLKGVFYPSQEMLVQPKISGSTLGNNC
ncbi:hypothetical protein E3N88_22880 [Mikania micrantha]|uniref:Uncharacterized protein n=1 Tax=Mikania micrantha TaxID=192012 RepID=A0A5N6NCR4_9ASTR|nr:hypothetical protein E3N88_22880 [Mikania micrantha]